MIKDYIIEKKLGVGTYGTVYMVSKKSKNKNKEKDLYVIKQISLFGLNPSEIKDVKLEANLLSQIKSTYVVKYLDSFEENNNLNIVMEYCDGGDLEKLINDKKKFPLEEDLIWKLFIQIAIGLTAIHNLKILHRDLKTSNIFLTKDLKIKIGDLGVAKKLSRSNFAKTIIGTPYYLSPEICEEKPYNEKSDVWALGCIVYELCTFNHPFNAKSQGALILKILNSNPIPIRSSYSDNLKKVINLLLEKNLNKRPSCKTILKLPYIIEKIKKFEMIEEYQSIGLKIKSNNKNFKKLYIKREKIDLTENTKEKYLTNDSNTSKNGTHFTKKENPWINFKQTKNKTKTQTEFKFKKHIKDNLKDNVKNITNSSFKSKYNENFFSNKKNKIKDCNSKDKKVIKQKSKSPINYNKKVYKLNKKNHSKKEITKKINNIIEDNKNKKEVNKIVRVDLTNTLELNNIITNYLDNAENSRESKALQNIKEFANNLNNYFTNNENIINNKKKEKEKLPFVLTNKDNNIEQINEANNINNENKINSDNKKEHENILNFDVGRLASSKMGINSYDELLNDFAPSRGNTLVNNLNNNLSNSNKKSISPFDFQVKNSNINNINNNLSINNSDSLFQVFDNKSNNIRIFNKDNNLCESDEEIKNYKNRNLKNIDEEDNSDKDDSGEENVRTIHCDNAKISIGNNKDEKERILEDKKLLSDRLESIKRDMFNLIGETDYKYVMELYSFIDKSKIDEIYFKIEEYVQKYDEDKKDKFDMLYFKLISTDCQIQQKNGELQKLLLNDF